MINSLRKAKLKWHCRRGMLELDIILLRFVEREIDALTESEFAIFEKLLGCTDPELFSWLMGHSTPEDREFANFVERIKLQDRPL